MPIEPPRAREDCGIDADEIAVEIDERAAGIARIDRRIRLDEELIVGDADLGARQRRDDAARHRLPDAERIADGEHQIADFEIVGIAHRERRQVLLVRIDLEHGEIGALVGEQQLGFEFAPVGEHDADIAAAQDHVIVGDDETLAVDDDARAQRILHPLARRAEDAVAAEEAAEERIGERPLLALRHEAPGIDIDDGGRGLLDHRRESHLYFGACLRDRLILG